MDDGGMLDEEGEEQAEQGGPTIGQPAIGGFGMPKLVSSATCKAQTRPQPAGGLAAQPQRIASSGEMPLDAGWDEQQPSSAFGSQGGARGGTSTAAGKSSQPKPSSPPTPAPKPGLSLILREVEVQKLYRLDVTNQTFMATIWMEFVIPGGAHDECLCAGLDDLPPTQRFPCVRCSRTFDSWMHTSAAPNPTGATTCRCHHLSLPAPVAAAPVAACVSCSHPQSRCIAYHLQAG